MMGNSEVGHLEHGEQDVLYIRSLQESPKDIEEGTFFENEALLKAVENCKKITVTFIFRTLIRWWCT